MASNYWASTHHSKWVIDKPKLAQSNSKDRQLLLAEDLRILRIHYSHLIQRLGEGLRLRQRVIATSIVYFKRFYVNNSFIDCEPRLVLTTCLYLASKVEECTTQAKKYVIKMKEIDPSFPYEMNHILECEYYVLEELEFSLLVFHPYRALPTYLHDADCTDRDYLDTAWNIVNDSYLTDVSLLYAPHVIALACIYVAAQMRNIDLRKWFEEITVDMKDIWDVAKELLDLYANLEKVTDTAVKAILSKYPAGKLNRSSSSTVIDITK
eukprot:TRINITY_DN7244_c0_g3_i2.p1 TRINITY_DN7244_c0_g3~~TRINITY_DN7244_c0_g3_i2.p1  ORF type:complete len:266 (+),score=34.58 TRINITY_DN7244_c0_g3_i2:210-1007(+)